MQPRAYEAQKSLQPAKIPFLPLLEKVAEKFVLYGVLSLLNRTYAVSNNASVPGEAWDAHHDRFGR